MPSHAAHPPRPVSYAARLARLRLNLSDFAEELMILGQFAFGRDWSASIIGPVPVVLNLSEGLERPAGAIKPGRRY